MWENSGALTVPDQISESCVPSLGQNTEVSGSPSVRLSLPLCVASTRAQVPAQEAQGTATPSWGEENFIPRL